MNKVRRKKTSTKKTPTEVKFEVKYPEIMMDCNEASPYIYLTKEKNPISIKYLRKPKERVINVKEVLLVIDYPVGNKWAKRKNFCSKRPIERLLRVLS